MKTYTDKFTNPIEQRSLSASGAAQCAIILPGELNMQFKLEAFEAISDKAGSQIRLYQEDGLESTLTADATAVTALAVDQNGASYNAGDIVVIVPFNWCSPISDLRSQVNVGLPFPFKGQPQMAVVAAGSSANALNLASAVTCYQHDHVYRMAQTAAKPVGAADLTWPQPGEPRAWYLTDFGKTALILLDGTAACSIPYFNATKLIDEGYWHD